MSSLAYEIRKAQNAEEDAIVADHEFDNAIILTFIGLLTLTLLTCWSFKFYRLSYVHETGLAIVYGLIAGLVIRYGTSTSSITGDGITFRLAPATNQTSNHNQSVPKNLLVNINFSDPANSVGTSNGTRIIYHYVLKTQVNSTVQHDESLTDKATFNPELFFNGLLPPIIFYAGYIMKRRHFFRNIGAILLIAFLGTTIAATVTALVVYCLSLFIPSVTVALGDAFFFGALISATDPVTVLAVFNELHVDVDLYAIVFGESVLNDVIAIVMAKSVEQFQKAEVNGSATFADVLRAIGNFVEAFVCSFLIGFAVAAITSLVTKFTRLRDFPLLETSMFVLLSYSTFVLAEALGLTGIVALLFCGIAQAHYSYNNLSTESRFRTRQVFELLSFLSENFVFVYIGVSTITFSNHSWNVLFILVAFLAIILGRAVNIYPLSWLLNLGRRAKIDINKQHMLMFVGLRGAMAFALAIRSTSSEARRLFFSTTLVIVMATVFLCGGFTKRLLICLHVPIGVDEDADTELVAMGNSDTLHSLGGTVASVTYIGAPRRRRGESQSISVPGSASHVQQPTPVRKARFFALWSSFDRRLMKPLLTHAQPALTETLPPCCFPFARFLSSAEQLAKASRTYARFVNDRAYLHNESTATIADQITDEPAAQVQLSTVYRRANPQAASVFTDSGVSDVALISASPSNTPSDSDASLVSLSGSANDNNSEI